MDKQQQIPETVNNDEVSLKDIILKLRGWWRYLLSKWLIILFFGIAGAALGLTYAWIKKPKYAASLTFVLEENKGGGLSSYAGIASQMGIDLSGSSGIGVFSGDNIIEFLQSRFIVEKALLSPVNDNGKRISLATLYINVNDLRRKWKDDIGLQQINFPVDPDRSKFSRLQDSVLNDLYQGIVKRNMVVEKPDKKSSFISVSCISADEIFSKVFTEQLVKEATDFYIDTKTKRSRRNVDLLAAKADSLERLLNKKTYSIAESEDLNQNPIRRIATVSSELASRDRLVLQTIYGEVLKNLELSRMSMAQATPAIQIVDTPILPLKVVKTGKLKGFIAGLFLGVFLTIMVLTVRKIFKEVMS